MPSIEDSGPIMSCEVLMTGTPLVTFDVGIAVDLVSCDTGYMATNKNHYDSKTELTLF